MLVKAILPIFISGWLLFHVGQPIPKPNHYLSTKFLVAETTMSNTTVTGKIEKKSFGFGVWALVGDDGKTYELKNAPNELQQQGVKAKVTGKIRTDVMTTAMIGPVLEVESFELVE